LLEPKISIRVSAQARRLIAPGLHAPARQLPPKGPAVSDEPLETAGRLYDAFAAQDARALLALIAPEFHGVASEGMPDGLGGSYAGAEAMLKECWAPVFASFDVRAVPDEYFPVGPGRIVVIGHYVGTARRTGFPLHAAFAHILRIADGRVTELVQITDTGRWRDALGRSGFEPATSTG